MQWTVIDNEKCGEFLSKLTVARIAVDTETWFNLLNQKAIWRFIKKKPTNEPFLLTISTGEEDGNYAIYFNAATLPHIKTFLENPEIEKVFFNAKYDLHMLENMGIYTKGRIWDVMIFRHLLDENSEHRGLKDNAVKYIDPAADKWEIAVDETRAHIAKERDCKKDEVSYKDVPSNIMEPYACADTFYTIKLFDLWYPKLVEQDLLGVYENEERCLWEILKIERRGMKIDKPYVLELKETLTHEVEELRRTLAEMVGSAEFNPDSSEDLVTAYRNMGFMYDFKTDKDEWKTDAKTLEAFLLNCGNEPAEKLTETLLKYREESKILSTFVEGLLLYVQPDGRVHPEFWQTGTVTGRMSSSDPNFQNIPKDDTRIRRAFIPEDGYIFVYLDYAQQEYKLLAHYAQDKALMDAILAGHDVHTATGCLLEGISIDDWYNLPKDEQKRIRGRGKTANFAIVYGLGNAALAISLGYKINEPLYKKASALFFDWGYKPWKLPSFEALLAKCTNAEQRQAVAYFHDPDVQKAIQAAKDFKAFYFGQFPGIGELNKQVTATARKRGYVFNWIKRRRRLPYADAYKALNSLIQGGCGDILKERLPVVGKCFNGTVSGVVNLVHDEVQAEVHISELPLIPVIRDILNALKFRVPITVDVNWTDTNWADKKSFESVEKLNEVLGIGIAKAV